MCVHLWLRIIRVLRKQGMWTDQRMGCLYFSLDIDMHKKKKILKTCHQRNAIFDKCQTSNPVFLIQTSEKGMSLAVKSSIQELSSAFSHPLPTHTSKHGSRMAAALYRASGAQSMFMVTITSLIRTEMALGDLSNRQRLYETSDYSSSLNLL